MILGEANAFVSSASGPWRIFPMPRWRSGGGGCLLDEVNYLT
jgi:hypothetical protein